jgi:hypothetical protein
MEPRKAKQTKSTNPVARFRPTLTQMGNYLFAAAASGLAVLYITHQAFQQANQDAREARIAVERHASELETLKETTERQERELRELRRYLFSIVHDRYPNDERTLPWPPETSTATIPRRPGS